MFLLEYDTVSDSLINQQVTNTEPVTAPDSAQSLVGVKGVVTGWVGTLGEESVEIDIEEGRGILWCEGVDFAENEP